MTPKPLEGAGAALREFALAYSEASEEFPWEHHALKVRGKTFVFLASGDEGLSLSVKLPLSSVAALSLPFAEPTGYGLGKSGWVTARFPEGQEALSSCSASGSTRAIEPSPPRSSWPGCLHEGSTRFDHAGILSVTGVVVE